MRNQAASRGLCLFLATAASMLPAYGQQPGHPVDVQGTIGYAAFLDESFLHHHVVGGSVRYYLTSRLALEPQLLYMRESRADQDFIFIPNLTWDFRSRRSRVIPYFSGGAGLMRHRQLTGRGFYTSTTLLFSGGFGVRTFLSERVYVSPEFRIGFEPLLQATVSIGYAFGSRGK